MSVALAIAAAAGFTACGGGADTVKASGWARAFCQSYVSYAKEIGSISDRLNSKLRSLDPSARAEQKAAVVSFLDDAVARTNGLIRALDDAGEPDVKHGASFVKSVKHGFQQSRTTFADALSLAKKLPGGDAAAFDAGVARITQTLRSGGQQSNQTIASARTKYASKQLDRSFKGASACRPLA